MGIEDLRARPWVLLPGTLCTAAIFDPFLDALGVSPARRHAIPLTRPTVEDYLPDLLERAEGAVVCGFSLGAIVAAHLADRLPAARMILFGVNPHADDPAKAPGRDALAADVRGQGGRAALDPRLPSLLGPDPLATRTAILDMAVASEADIDAQTALALGRPGALAALARAPMPVLTLTGTEDGQAPPDLGRAAAQAAPRGTFRALPGLGHYALAEDPAACARAVAMDGTDV